MEALNSNKTSVANSLNLDKNRSKFSKIEKKSPCISLTSIFKTAVKVAAIALVALSGQSSATPIYTTPIRALSPQLHPNIPTKEANITLTIPLIISNNNPTPSTYQCVFPVSTHKDDREFESDSLTCKNPISASIELAESKRSVLKEATLKGMHSFLKQRIKKSSRQFKANETPQKKEQAMQNLQVYAALQDCLKDQELLKEMTRFGKPDSAHPENEALFHIGHVLTEIETLIQKNPDLEKDRAELTLIAVIHDSFKYAARELSAKEGKKTDHGVYARNFVARFLGGIEDVNVKNRLLRVVAYHDMGFYAYLDYHKQGASPEMKKQALNTLKQKVKELKECNGLELYKTFLKADSASGLKEEEPLKWALAQIREIEKELV